MSFGCYATPEYYMEFRKQQQEAMECALVELQKVNDDFGEKFGRKYGNGLFETHNFKPNTKNVIFTIGSITGTVREYMKKNKDIGLVKLKSFRPFPKNELRKLLKNVESIGVVEKDVSIGNHGAVYTELKAALQNTKVVISGFVCGLGGKDVRLSDIDYMVKKIKAGKEVEEWI
jgi:pyruvate ferredoxin oxidoreductase alpha subunit